MPLKIELIPAFKDNYFFLVTHQGTGERTVIDPGQAKPIIDILEENELDLILLTHHHPDHIGGAEDLMAEYDCPILGGLDDEMLERMPPLARPLEDGDIISIGTRGYVLDVPGHTLGHIAYFFPQKQNDEREDHTKKPIPDALFYETDSVLEHIEKGPVLFIGDTLFAGGCGRVFEGTMDMMFDTLQKIKKLPPETKIYCSHEYTLDNLTFAHGVFSEDEAIQKRLEKVHKQRRNNIATVPTTLAEELRTNVFLRAKSVEEFTTLREAKDKA